MMAHALALLHQAELDDDEPMARNTYIDSAHLHARALIEFFLQRGRGKDIRPKDFTPEWTPKPLDAAERLSENYQLLHKYLAHLSWERLSVDAPAWDYPNIGNDIIDVAEAWSEHLGSADQIMGDTFKPQVHLARETLHQTG